MFSNRFARALSIVPLLLVGSGAVVACAKHEPVASLLPKDDTVVARVNDTTITQYDVNQIAAHSLGNLVVAAGSDSFNKVRDAAVRSRAIAQASEAELSEQDKQSLVKELAAYREQLLVRRYLSKHAPPAPVTPEMVRAYYQAHPDRFGAKTERTYELLGSTRTLAPAERDKLLLALKGVETEDDWQASADKLSRHGFPVTLTVTSGSDKMLDQGLRDLLAQLQNGKPSPTTLLQGRVYLARVKGEQQVPPRPFEEVSGDIERLLTPAQLSAAVESASKTVLAKSKVQLIDAQSAQPEAKR